MNKNTRVRNGKTEVRYGGYYTYYRWMGTEREMRREVEITVWGPAAWDPSNRGDGSDIADAVEAAAKKKHLKNGECRECWRC